MNLLRVTTLSRARLPTQQQPQDPALLLAGLAATSENQLAGGGGRGAEGGINPWNHADLKQRPLNTKEKTASPELQTQTPFPVYPIP